MRGSLSLHSCDTAQHVGFGPCLLPGNPCLPTLVAAQIPALLPLAADHRPLLAVESADGEQRCLQALLHWAAADAAGPATPMCDVNVNTHLVAYSNALLEAAQRGPPPQHDELALILLAYASGSLRPPPNDSPIISLQRQLSALELLSEPGSARSVRRQLAEAATAAAGGCAAALPSLEQLLYVCHRTLARSGGFLLQAPQLASLPAVMPLCERVVASAEALIALQPDSPNSWLMASGAAVADVKLAAAGQHHKVLAVERLLRGAELAQQQRGDVAFAICACNAVLMGAAAPVGGESHSVLPASLAARALAAAAEVEPAVKRASRLLPATWVQPLQPMLQAVQRLLAANSGQQLAAAELKRVSLSQVLHDTQQAIHCDGCGRWSAGLRRCSRCKAVFYCRWALVGWLRCCCCH